MRTAAKILAVCSLLLGVSTPLTSTESMGGKVTALVLEKNDGERRAWRPIEGAKGGDAELGRFILKVDRRNGGSQRLVFVTEDLPPVRRSTGTDTLARTRLSFYRTDMPA